jgi:hypothetical protein
MSKHPNRFTPAALQASLETRQARADARAADLAPLIAALQAAGVTKLQGIAAALNERGRAHAIGPSSLAPYAALAAAEAAGGVRRLVPDFVVKDAHRSPSGNPTSSIKHRLLFAPWD